MRTTWSALHASLSRQMNRDTAKAAFLEMQKTHPDLARFASISCLMQHQHAVGGDASAKFDVIRSLVSAAQSERDHRSTAQVMVMVALWPGLDAVFWRLWRGFPDARDDLASDIIARLGEAILAMDLEKVTAVTATLLRNLERDLGRDLIGARVIADTSHPIDDPAVEMQASGWNAHGEACERCPSSKDLEQAA